MIFRKAAAQAKTAPASAKRVLVIKFGSLSEFVQALGAAKYIREHHVGARITLLTTDELKSFAEKCPYFDVVESDGKPKEPQAAAQLLTRIRSAKYEMVYDLESSNRTNSYYTALRPWPPNWSGLANGASHPFPDSARRLHPLERFAVQLEAAGVTQGQEVLPDIGWIRMALRDPPRLSPEYFGIRGPFILLLPRGNAATPQRQWPEQKYVEIAKRLAANGVTPVVLGGAEERDVGAAIARAEPKAKNLISRADLFQIAGLAEKGGHALGDDVDLMHFVAAAGATCLVLRAAAAEHDNPLPRGTGGVVALTATVIADLPVEQVERQLRNCGVFRVAATA